MAVKQLDGRLYREMLAGGAAHLGANAAIVNDLNVFPIPDGDTGDNMRMTMDGGVSVACDTAHLGDMAGAVAQGMLLGARGNSGVILSQFFGGIAEGLRGAEQADTVCLAAAFEQGVRRAYEAVIRPTEGTMLTVMREATAAAAAAEAVDIESFFVAFIEEAKRSLDRTPDLLPVLKEAGVIDSGGAGLIYIVQGMYRVLCGEPVETVAATASTARAVDTSSFTADSVMEFGYCTECLLQLQNSKVDAENFDVSVIVELLQSLGDSIVAVKAGTVVKIHVHTFTPGRVLEFCQQFGEFLTLKVENMCIQHNESTTQNRYSEQMPEHKEFAVVAVASGDGLADAFVQFGADAIVHGGQTMNPSAEEFVEAFGKVDADHIIVMPNNGNIILAARQAASLYEGADVRVLETHTMAEGYVAFTMLDFSSGDIDTILEELQTAVADVDTGFVTYAVRDTSLNGVQVHKDDFIGFSGKTMLCSAPDRVAAACGLLDRMDFTDKQVIIAICGKDASPEELAAVRDYAARQFENLEWYELDGKQEVYSFIFAVE